MTGDEARERFEEIWKMYERGNRAQAHDAVILLSEIARPVLPDMLRGNRGRYRRMLLGHHGVFYGRTSAYELIGANKLGLYLADLGLVDTNRDYRDVRSNRKVKTILRELARLRWNLNAPEDQESLREAYEIVRDKPLPWVKRFVQTLNNELAA